MSVAPADLAKFRAWEDSQLNSYGWVDRTAGVVHIPIERAMEIIAQQGATQQQKAGTIN